MIPKYNAKGRGKSYRNIVNLICGMEKITTKFRLLIMCFLTYFPFRRGEYASEIGMLYCLHDSFLFIIILNIFNNCVDLRLLHIFSDLFFIYYYNS